MKNQLLNNQIALSPRFVEVDSMRVVHHSKYWIWFEESRFSFLRKVLNVSHKELVDLEIYMPVIDCQCKYRHAIPWEAKIIVDTKLEVLKAPYFIFHYRIIDKDNNKVLSTGFTKHAFIDWDFNLRLKTPTFLMQKLEEVVDKMPYAFKQHLEHV